MELTQAQRLQFVVRWLAKERHVNQQEIAALVGYNSMPAFSQLTNGKKKVPKDMPAKIAALDPRININFLTGASDRMLLDGAEDVTVQEPDVVDVGGNPLTAHELAQMVTDLTQVIKEQQGIIRMLFDAWLKRGE